MKTMPMRLEIPLDLYMHLTTQSGDAEVTAREGVLRAIQTWVFLREQQADGKQIMVGMIGEEGWTRVDLR